ncbi:Rrf2 family transcriptional regulator [Megasphaera sp.]|uniref:RrF2 family transcriptional regulator n=1 Tax=Megasphaera sp. TaxID=2023260 RepID=UPI0030791DF2
MIITRETDYAIRILRSLADLQLKNIREISDEQLVPRQFAYKISKKLERAGFIEIIRGAQGGCRLTRDLHDITLMDIINVMERENMITSCLDGDFQCPYHRRYGFCDVHEALAGVQGKLSAYLATIHLYDIMFPHGGPAPVKASGASRDAL